MANTTFSNGITLTDAEWFNDVNDAIYENVYNVRNSAYGAVGNGSTDDTTAVQSALTAGAGKNVFFPPGTYKITSTLAVSANTVLIIDGATLDFTNASSGVDIRLDGQNIHIYGKNAYLNFESVQCIAAANGANVDGLHIEGIEVTCQTAGNGHGIQINNTGTSDNLTIINNRWVDCSQSILLNDGPSSMNKIVIKGNRIEGGYRDGIQVNRPTLGSTDVLISENVIDLDATGSGLTTDGFGVSIEKVVRLNISDNVITFSRREGVHLDGSSGDDNDYTVISGNVMLTGEYGILVNEPAKSISIVNNICTKSGSVAVAGIAVVSSTETGINNFVIMGNIVAGYSQGIYGGLGGESIPIIQGNYVHDCTKGIDLERAYQAQGICNNVLEDCTVGVESTSGGVIGKNIYRDVTTICDNTGQRATFLKGFSVIKTGISTTNGANSQTLIADLFTASARAYGFASMMWFDETSNTNWALRKNTLQWDGSSLTSTSLFNTSGGGALSTTAFAVASDDLNVSCANSGGTITTSITLDFDGDLLVL